VTENCDSTLPPPRRCDITAGRGEGGGLGGGHGDGTGMITGDGEVIGDSRRQRNGNRRMMRLWGQ